MGDVRQDRTPVPSGNRPMIHPALYRLLGMPELAAEPTHYRLLGLTPRECTPQLIDWALHRRRKQLRLKLPGPQFIPLAADWEEELARAAATLRDPRRRTAYNQRLASEAKRPKPANLIRQQLAVRRAIREAMADDGTIDDLRRPELAATLEDIGLTPDEIDRMLAGIPLPAPPGSPVATADELHGFLAATTDLCIWRDRLLPEDELALFNLAGRLGIGRGTAAKIIEARLRAADARRAERDPDALKDDFRQRIESAYPPVSGSDRLSESDRQRLIVLGVAGGLTETEAAEVVDGLFGHPQPAPAGGAEGHTTASLPRTGPPLPSDLDVMCPTDDEVLRQITSSRVADGRRAWRVPALAVGTALLLVIVVALAVTGVLDEPRRWLEDLVSGILPASQPRLPAPGPPAGPHSRRPAEVLTVPQEPRAPADAERRQGVAPGPPGPQERPEGAGPGGPDATGIEREPVAARSSPSAPSSTPAAPPPEVAALPTQPAGQPVRSSGPPPVPPSVATDRIRASFAMSPAAVDYLADVAATALACLDRACRLTGRPSGRTEELESLFAANDRAAILTSRTTVRVASASGTSLYVPPAQPVPLTAAPLDMEKVKRDLASTSAQVRYRAIEALRMADTPEAAGVLLAALESRIGAGPVLADMRTACHILRALKSMRQLSIPSALVQMLPACRTSFMAFQIAKTLEEGSGISAPAGAGIMPLGGSREQQTECAAWWREQLARGTIRWAGAGLNLAAPFRPAGRGPMEAADTPPPSTVAGPSTAAWQPDPLPLKLLAAIEHFAGRTNDALSGLRWNRGALMGPAQDSQAPADRFPPVLTAGTDVAETVCQTLQRGVQELERLVRTCPGRSDLGTEVDTILTEREARELAAEGPLQRAVVNLDAQGQLLQLLARLLDPGGQRRADLDRLGSDRMKAAQAAPNVLAEIREAGYHNLLLWDLVLALSREAEP